MAERSYPYVIVGGGLAGASAVEGIRQVDPGRPILLIGSEPDLPYERPPLTKQLWTGGTTIEKTRLHDQGFYDRHHVDLRLGRTISGLDASAWTLRDSDGQTIRYERLLLATGGTPRRLDIPGGDLNGVRYYRTLSDYRALREVAEAGKSVIVIGGGFIGSELAASLCQNKLKTTMIFPSQWLVSRVFPESLGRYLTRQYQARGVTVHTGDTPVSIAQNGSGLVVNTKNGEALQADLVVVGIGITLNLDLATMAGAKIDKGVVVDDHLRTSVPGVFAAGDIARFPMEGFGPRRLEHYDAAISQGKHAGRNMAGANERFTYVPFFFSDLFEFGYEAVGDIDSRLTTFADWQEENKTGVVYYLNDQRLRGAMMCNVWEKVDDARALIARDEPVTEQALRGAIQ